MADYEVIAEGLAFPEGPVVMADGSVIVVEIHGKQVTRCWNGRKEVVARPGGGPNGAAVGPDGALYVCNSGGMGHDGSPTEAGRIERIDIASGKVDRLYEACDGTPLGAPNDLMFDCDGNIWFTDLGRSGADCKYYGGLFCASPDGSAITRIYGRAMSYNGVGISPDMQTNRRSASRLICRPSICRTLIPPASMPITAGSKPRPRAGSRRLRVRRCSTAWQ